jgi:hypothetical protein
MSGVATTASKSIQPPESLSTTSSPADVVGAGVLRFLLFFAGGNHEHFLALAEAVRQHHGAADHLVRMFRIDAEASRRTRRSRRTSRI